MCAHPALAREQARQHARGSEAARDLSMAPKRLARSRLHPVGCGRVACGLPSGAPRHEHTLVHIPYVADVADECPLCSHQALPMNVCV